jgi:hypothetical protein
MAANLRSRLRVGSGAGGRPVSVVDSLVKACSSAKVSGRRYRKYRRPNRTGRARRRHRTTRIPSSASRRRIKRLGLQAFETFRE